MSPTLIYAFPILLLAGSLCIVTTLLVTALQRKWNAPPALTVLAVAVMGGHVVVGVALLQTQFGVTGDVGQYDRAARNIAGYLSGEQRLANLSTQGKEGWAWVLGILYWLASPDRFLGVVINACALSLIPPVMYRLFAGSSRSLAMTAAVLASLSPAWWLWGSLPLREAINLLFISVLTVSLCLYLQAPQVRYLAYMLLAAIGIFYFRGSLVVILAGGASIAIVLNLLGSRTRSATRVLVALPLLVVMLTVGQAAYSVVGGNLTIERAAEVRASQSAAGGSGFGVENAAASGVGGSLVQAVTAFPRILLGPFPWELPANIAVAPEVFFWWGLLALAVRGGLSPGGRRFVVPLGLLTLGLLLALAVYSGNYGTLVRLRSQSVAILVPLAAVGWHELRQRRRRAPATRSGPPPTRRVERTGTT